MIGGIFETIGETLGVGKEKYFLELDDADKASVKNPKESAKAAANTVKEASTDVAGKAQALVDESAKAQDVVKESASKSNRKAKKVAIDKSSAQEKAAVAKQQKTDGTAPTQSAPKAAEKPAPTAPTAEEIIVNAIAAAPSEKKVAVQDNVLEGPGNFSTDYLMTPIRTSRRRPGPSLGEFKTMAKEVNPRLRN
ncbi:MAG: hypothetical protein AAFU53_16715 [Cyanobacteria bacterium J06632_3]